MNKNDCRSGLLILVTAAVLASSCGRGEPGQTQRTIPSERQNADAAGFKEFTDRVKDYVKLHKALESGLPAERSPLSSRKWNAAISNTSAIGLAGLG